MPQPASRVSSLDALRGLVMVIMALDHVRDFFHAGAFAFSPEDLTKTSTALFFTRWITHFCAPVFSFLAGAGVFLWVSRGRSAGAASAYLVKRGLWLVFLDVVVMRLALFFSLTSGPVVLTVLWVLGWSMVVLAALVHVPVRVLAPLSVAVIALHNLTDGATAPVVWRFLHQPMFVPISGVLVIFAYPLVPWFAVMSAGFCCGHIVLWSAERRQRWLLGMGVGLTAAFFVLRYFNAYGDPQPWSVQPDSTFTALSFLRTMKYPPSLLYLLMTIGPALLVWRWFDRLRFGRYNPLLVFGRVPLFYFLGHFFLIHALVYVFAAARYGTVAFLSNPMPTFGGDRKLYPPDFGYDLPVVYLVWALVTVLMYPACLLYAAMLEKRKARRVITVNATVFP